MKKLIATLTVLAVSAGCSPDKSPELSVQSPVRQPNSRYTVVAEGAFRDRYIESVVMFSVTDTKTGERWLLFQGPRGLSVVHSDHKEPVGGGK